MKICAFKSLYTLKYSSNTKFEIFIPILTPQGVGKIMSDTQKIFELLDKQVDINTEIISHLAELCMQPVEGVLLMELLTEERLLGLTWHQFPSHRYDLLGVGHLRRT